MDEHRDDPIPPYDFTDDPDPDPERLGGFPPSRRPADAARRLLALIVVGVVAAGLALAIVAGGHLLGALANEPPGLPGGALGLLQDQSGAGATRASLLRVEKGLVNINTSFDLAHAKGAATGMVITPDGFVLTNNHVINGATGVQATSVATGETYTATVVGYDRSHDIAVIKLDGAGNMPTVPLGDSSGLRVGDHVTALGNARGLGGVPKVAPGTITALDRTIVAGEAGGVRVERLTGMIQTDAHIIGGDSGGALVDGAGQVIGMNTASSAGTSSSHSSVIGFAIPMEQALSEARMIMAGQARGGIHIGPTAFLGVAVAPDSGSPRALPGLTQGGGAVVGGLVPGYPAENIGIGRGDVITSLGGAQVTSSSGLTDVLERFHPGDLVRLEWRDAAGALHSASVTLAEGPPA